VAKARRSSAGPSPSWPGGKAGIVRAAPGAGAARARAPSAEPAEGECQADHCSRRLGGLPTDQLNSVADGRPFTVAGEPYPIRDDAG
jgi:hypothetical protein